MLSSSNPVAARSSLAVPLGPSRGIPPIRGVPNIGSAASTKHRSETTGTSAAVTPEWWKVFRAVRTAAAWRDRVQQLGPVASLHHELLADRRKQASAAADLDFGVLVALRVDDVDAASGHRDVVHVAISAALAK